MKKIAFLICMFLASVGAFAQKEYVQIVQVLNSGRDYRIYLSGTIPASVNNNYQLWKNNAYGKGYFIACDEYDRPAFVEILNCYMKDGYVIESTTPVTDGIHYLLSKEKPGQEGNKPKYRKGDVNEDESVDISDVVNVINIMAGEE